MGLNDAQKQAIAHFKSPCMVIAGPGSGKTKVLVSRVKNLIETHHVLPQNILVLTYTKAAALSMQQRFIKEMQGASLPVTFGTFHAICYQMLKTHFHLKKDCLLSEREKFSVINSILRQLNKELDVAEQLLTCISLLKNGFSMEALPYPPGMARESFEQIKQAYATELEARGKIDFDDMVSKCLTLFEQNKAVLLKWQRQFSFLLVDEFQDCNVLQYEIIKLLSGKERNLFVVGDDDQSIYGFRGAKPGIMQQFAADFSGTKEIVLEANYRSNQEIVTAAQKVISVNKDRFHKNIYAATLESKFPVKPVNIQQFKDKAKQFAYLAMQIKKMEQYFPFSNMAVIFRTNRETQDLIPYLTKENIPYTINGVIKSKYAHFSVQDICSYLQLIVGRLERYHLLKIMNKPARGIVRDWIKDNCFSWKQLQSEAQTQGGFEASESVAMLRRQCMHAKEMSPYLAMNWIRKVIGYEKWLLSKAGMNRELYVEWKNLLDEIQSEAANFITIEDWLVFVERQVQENEGNQINQKETGLQLLTMHAAKGLEFSYVCIPNANEGVIPHGRMPDKAAREEERRLFYVAMTRAKTALEILYLTGTKEHPRLPSSFLNVLKEYDYSPSTSSSNS